MTRYLPVLLVITIICAGVAYVLSSIMDYWIGDGERCAMPGRYERAVRCSACDAITCTPGNAICGYCWERLPEETRRVLRHSRIGGWTGGAIIDRAHLARLKAAVVWLRENKVVDEVQDKT